MKRILVVDDSATNLHFVEGILKDKYNLSLAKSGERALKFLEKNQVDLILLDLMMPVMDGTTFLEYKRNDKKIAGIPVIIITADDTTKRQTQTLDLGADDYIVKPFVPEIAKRRVSHVLESKQNLEDRLKSYPKELLE